MRKHDHHTTNTLVTAALTYAARGWHVLPCNPQTKRPLTTHGLKDASTDPTQITTWWQEWPCALIAIRTGPESGLWVLDIDVHLDKGIDGFATLALLENQHGALPETLTSTTPRGGWHLFFQWHAGIRNDASGKLGKDLDIRGEGGYAIVPPSMRFDRKTYSWREGYPAEPVEAPPWLIELLTTTPAVPATASGNGYSNNNYHSNGNGYARTALEHELSAVINARVGQRNHILNRASFSLHQLVSGGALSESEVQDGLFNAALACGLVKDDGADSVRATIASGATAGLQQPRPVPERTPTVTTIKPETLAALMAAGTDAATTAPQQTPPPTTTPTPSPAISASPFVWCDPMNISPRAWLYGRHYIRRFLSCTVAPGGQGKTSLAIVEALAMVTGRALLGITPTERARVWIWNGEDPVEELNRRITAAMLHHQITPGEVEGYLFRNTGRETPVIMATQTRNGTTVDQATVGALIETIRQNKIDVLIVDPFVKSHRVSENDNVAIDMIATQWAQIADVTNCAVELLHHPRKTGGAEIGIEDARGAGSLIGASRSARVLNRMTKQEAEDAEIEDAWRYLRVNDGKANMAPPPEKADWYKLASIALGNNDNVGTVTTWTWPNPFEGVTVYNLRVAQQEVSEGGPWRASHQAENWVGNPIAKALKLDVHKDSDRKRIKALLKTWMKNGMFVVVAGKGRGRHQVQLVEVGTWADD